MRISDWSSDVCSSDLRLAQQLPKKLAMEYMLTGDPIPAARAAEFGLVNHVVPLADLLPTAIALAEKIAGNAPLSVQASKRVALGIEQGRIAPDAPFWDGKPRESSVLMRSEDATQSTLA